MSSRSAIPAAVRERALSDANHECDVCPNASPDVGGESTLHLHHRKPVEEGGTHALSNIAVLCEDCHHHHHSTRVDPDEIHTDLQHADIETTPADRKLIGAIEAIAPATTGVLAEEAGVSEVHALRRLYALAASGLVSVTTDREWDLTERVDEPLRGQLPESPERAARMARDDIIRRMVDSGLSNAETATIVGLDERTVPVAANRARAFDPPIPPAATGREPDLNDIERRLASLERTVGTTTAPAQADD